MNYECEQLIILRHKLIKRNNLRAARHVENKLIKLGVTTLIGVKHVPKQKHTKR